MVAFRTVTRRCAFVCALLLTPVAAQESDALLIELLDRVQQLRDEVSSVRNENEILRHRLDVLINQLGVEPRETHVSTVVAPFTRATETGGGTGMGVGEVRASTMAAPFARASAAGETAAQTGDGKRGGETDGGLEEQRTAVEPASGEREPASGERLRSVREPPPGQRRFALARPGARGSAEEREAYLDALAYLDESHYDGLRAALRRFISTYPGSAYEPKARYWIAESYYTERQLDRAAYYFEQYLRHFPDADRVDDARLKLAYIHHDRDDPVAARRLLEKLSESRDERVRGLAERRLELIDKAPEQ